MFSFWRELRKRNIDLHRLPGCKDPVRNLGLVAYRRESAWQDFWRTEAGNEFECRQTRCFGIAAAMR